MPPTEQRAVEDEEQEAGSGGRKVTLGRVLAVAVCVAIALMWAYVFAFSGNYHPAGWLEDRTFPEAAEKACKPFAERLADLPPASSAGTSAERADLVDRGSEILSEMQTALRALIPEGKDGKHIAEWVEDWTTHIEDRNRFSEKVRSDPDAEFIETAKQGSQLSSALNRFAKVNEMPSCVTAKDV